MVLVVAVLGFNKLQEPKEFNNLLLENVEALADIELDADGVCAGNGSVVCPFNNTNVSHVFIYYSMPH